MFLVLLEIKKYAFLFKGCMLFCVIVQVWKNRKIWEGFVKCCQRTKPQSFQVLLQLPAIQLKDVFALCPELREPLLTHVQAFTPHQVSRRLHQGCTTHRISSEFCLRPSSALKNNTLWPLARKGCACLDYSI